MTECPSAERLDGYLSGSGCADEHAAIGAHLEGCARCRTWLAEARANAAMLESVVRALAAGAEDAERRPAPRADDDSAAAPPRVEAEPADAVPGTIGRYRILRVIAEGGMGLVYEAEQESPRRRVALKVIRPGITAPSSLRRFEYEAQVLGRLHHPGIAQIFEAGTADAGYGPQPFFAMEFVEGRRLSDYAAEHRLGTRQRLQIFATVCHAVHHAHQKGVIHRDLKPGNILVDKAGQPKVLDFGVARATDADIQATTVQTGVGQLIGTVPYMSPEQVAGDPRELDTRSDIYSLGVVLYELLAGRLPYDVGRKPVPEAVRVIRDEDPTPLSSINRLFRGDIETIVTKALEKDVARRYQSASALAADIERHLHDEPIAARRQSRLYLLRKTVRRHRGWVAVGGLGFTALVIIAVAASLVAAQRRAVITALEGQARQREAQLADADARRSALTYYYEAVDLIRRGVRRDDALAMLDRALEIDPTFSAAYLERGFLRAPDEVFSLHSGRVELLAVLPRALSDFERAHEFAGGDPLVAPETGKQLTPAEARALPVDKNRHLLAFPDVLRLEDGSLVRIAVDGRRVPVGGPGSARALLTAGNILAARLRLLPGGHWFDVVIAEHMDRYYQRAAALDPADVYPRLSKALAAAAKPSEQAEAARLLEALSAEREAAGLVELWQALAEVRLGGPRRRFPEVHPERDPVAAEQAARQVTTLAPADAYGWYLLGLALQEQGRYAEAVHANEEALAVRAQGTQLSGVGSSALLARQDPFSGPILTNLATSHAMLGNFETAWPLYEQALERSGHSPIVLVERAEAYHGAGVAHQAQADLMRASDQVLRGAHLPLPAMALPLSWALLTFPDPDLRDPPAARQTLTALRQRQLCRDDPAVVSLLAYAYVQCSNPQAALDLVPPLRPASEPRPFHDAVLAATLHAIGEPEQAWERLHQAESAAQRLVYPDARLTRLLEQVRSTMPPD